MSRKVKCPVCKEVFELEDDLERGDSVSCASCYEDLKITGLNPPKVEEAMDYSDYTEDIEEDRGEYENKGRREEWQ